MKRFLLLFPLLTSSIGSANAGENPFNYFNLNFGIGNYKSPLIYTYSLEVCRDIKISNRSSFLIGIEWDNFYQHTEYDVDTNFISMVSPTGPNTSKYYNRTEKMMVMNLAMAYKFWLKKSKTNSFYLQSEINYNFFIREVHKAESYYRDSNQTLFLGPYSGKIVEDENYRTLLPDNISPAISVGYLRNINKNLAYHFKLDLIFTIPEWSPVQTALIYPKIGFGLAFR